jgi:peptidoglycan hydrolase-like protein with peptidoglycan-binding domain
MNSATLTQVTATSIITLATLASFAGAMTMTGGDQVMNPTLGTPSTTAAGSVIPTKETMTTEEKAMMKDKMMMKDSMMAKGGMSMEDVTRIQEMLKEKGFLTLPTGVAMGKMGPKTKMAIMKFQKSMGLPMTGNYGVRTKAAMEKAMMMKDDAMKPKYDVKANVKI